MIYKITYDLQHELLIDIFNSFDVTPIVSADKTISLGDIYEFNDPAGDKLYRLECDYQTAMKSLQDLIRVYSNSFKSTKQKIKQLKSNLQRKFPVKINFSVGFDASYFYISMIVVNQKSRNMGVATKVINNVIEFANSNELNIRLLPSNVFGSDLIRLIEFYESFGFKFLDTSTQMQYNYKQ